MTQSGARRLTLAAALIFSAAPVVADDGPVLDTSVTEDFLGRLRALRAPSAPIDMYADEKAADLARIGGRAALFDPDLPGLGPEAAPVIVMFHGPGCPECAQALAELEQLTHALQIRAVVLDVSDQTNAADMAALGLDMLPSYVMRDRLIRGQMPRFVLERYLSEARD